MTSRKNYKCSSLTTELFSSFNATAPFKTHYLVIKLLLLSYLCGIRIY